MWTQLGLSIMRLGGFGGASQGGPYLLLSNGTSRLLLTNGTDKLLITGVNPSTGNAPTYFLLGF